MSPAPTASATASALVSNSPTPSPYQLDPAQVLKATQALTQHLRSVVQAHAASGAKRNLLADGDDSSDADDDGAGSGDAEPIWLQLTTKTHIVDQKRLKPGRIALPHSLNRPSSSVCLITPDPQRAYKNLLADPSFPAALASQIRILGMSKLKARYKSYESRRQLVAEYDAFLADDRIILQLPRIVGKILYEGTKRPVPVHLEGYKKRDDFGKRIKGPDKPPADAILPAAAMAREIEKALSSARVHLSPSVTTAVRVGFSSFTPEQLADNVTAVVEGMQAKFITKGWRNIRAVHIKGPNSAALPIWAAPELWVDRSAVASVEAAESPKRLAAKSKKDSSQPLQLEAKSVARDVTTSVEKPKKRKVRATDLEAENQKSSEQTTSKKEKKHKKAKTATEEGFGKEMAERREKLRQHKAQAMARVS